jgi:ribosomal protein S21
LKNRMQYEKPSVTRRIAKKKARYIAKIQLEQN